MLEIKKSINSCIDVWSKKERVDKRVLNEWRDNVYDKVNRSINKLKM